MESPKNHQNHSLPNLQTAEPSSEVDARKLYSLSLSQLKKDTAFSSDAHHKPSPFNIKWLHGYNAKAGVINLNDTGSATIFYAASNCGVLYNWTSNNMRILQGHRHMVCFIDKDEKADWLVTADSGPENVIIIWDCYDYFPQRTLFSPHGPTKLGKVSISGDAKYLLTLAYPERGKADIYWWIWSFNLEEPHAKLSVELPRDSVIDMGFNPYNTLQFLLLTKHEIWLGVSVKIFVVERGVLKETNDYELKIRMVPKKLHGSTDYGRLTCFTFVNTTNQVIVGTNRGAVFFYGYTLEMKKDLSSTKFEKMKFVKPLKVEKHGINDIKWVDGFLVTGNTGGEIHFYDEQMKLMYWIQGFKVDSVKGLSFNVAPRSYQIFDPKCGTPCLCWEKAVAERDPETGYLRQKLLKKKLPIDSTTDGKPFIIRDFIVCTQDEGIGFVDFVTEKLKTIVNTKTSFALSLTVHPERPFVCIGYENGMIDMINFLQHQLFKRLDLRTFYKVVTPLDDDSIDCNIGITIPQLSVTCLKYSPSGLHLACGLNTGQLVFLDPTTLDVITPTPFKDTSHAILEINYSPDSLSLAFFDAGKTVGLYKYCCENFVWKFIGKHRSHYKDISTVFFLPEQTESGDYKLLSLGTDRIMVEYDIENSSNECLEIYSLDRVDQTAIPLGGIPWPNPKNLNPEECRIDIPTILVANDEHKYKIINVATTMTLSTVLGPRYETPVCKMQLISRREGHEDLHYILFATKNVIGLQKMPLDGNPWKHVGLLGHPIEITEMCFREDLGFLFTLGAKDTVMTQWAANYRSVDSTSKRGGTDLHPYYCLIENGRPGWLFQEIRDLFYYIQILCQGTFSPAMRRVKDFIPIDSLPDLMRALGFYPSEYEVENLLIEAKYKVYLKKPVMEIDFEEFVKLYINHRPAFGYSLTKLRNAFKTFANMRNDRTYVMARDDFVETLSNFGECFSRELSWYLLSILSGHSFEDRTIMTENDFSFLPEYITFSDLATHILGIHDVDNISEQTSVHDSGGSQDFSYADSYY